MSFIATILTMYWLAPFLIKGVLKVLTLTLSSLIFIITFIVEYNLTLAKTITKKFSALHFKTTQSNSNNNLSYNDILLEIHESVVQAENPSVSLKDRKYFYINSLKLINAVNRMYPDKEELTYSSFLELDISSNATVQ